METSIFGASVETILGDTIATQFQVSAALAGHPQVAQAIFSLFSRGSRPYGTGAYRPATLDMTALQLVNDDKRILNGTKVGTAFGRPLEVVLYVVEDNYVIERVTGACDPATQTCFQAHVAGDQPDARDRHPSARTPTSPFQGSTRSSTGRQESPRPGA